LTNSLLAAKGEFINNQGMAGFAVWHIAGDSKDILLNAISDAMEISDCSGGSDDGNDS
jgi:chitinase